MAGWWEKPRKYLQLIVAIAVAPGVTYVYWEMSLYMVENNRTTYDARNKICSCSQCNSTWSDIGGIDFTAVDKWSCVDEEAVEKNKAKGHQIPLKLFSSLVGRTYKKIANIATRCPAMLGWGPVTNSAIIAVSRISPIKQPVKPVRSA